MTPTFINKEECKMEQNFAIAAQWIFLALAASIFSVRAGISIALTEIIVGVIGGNIVTLSITDWISFLSGVGAVILTFLSGAEIDPQNLRKNLVSSLSIGLASFFLPFAGGFLLSRYGFGWDVNGAKIAGIATSTTSVAVVYAVMVESRLSASHIGQSILASCFVTDLGTVVALGVLFTGFSWKIILLAAALLAGVILLSPITSRVFAKYGGRVCEVEIKFLIFLLLFFAWLAVYCQTEAILPAYIIGLAMAGMLKSYKDTLVKLRAITFTVFTPFYFLKAGSLVSLHAVYLLAGTILAFFVVKMAAKLIGVFPLTAFFHYDKTTGIYTTLLMSTGLTFGTISSLYGLTNHYINSSQYSVLVTTVILSAVVPTMIAQRWFFPTHIVSEEK